MNTSTNSESSNPSPILLPLGMANIIFEFSFSEDSPLEPPYTPSSPPSSPVEAEIGDGLSIQSSASGTANPLFPYVQCLIYRSDCPSNYFLWSGTLLSEPSVAFELKYDDDENISGVFNLFQNTSIGQYFVFFDVHYGLDLEHHYEGNMIRIPTS